MASSRRRPKKRITEIWKMQRAINNPAAPLLVYTEGRRDMTEVPPWEGILDMFGVDYKMYVEARKVYKGRNAQRLKIFEFQVVRRVEDQDW